MTAKHASALRVTLTSSASATNAPHAQSSIYAALVTGQCVSP
jgi:hypothetical protein